MERAEKGEKLTEKEILQHMRRIDKGRAAARSIISDVEWGKGTSYHLTVNTTDWNIKQLAAAVAQMARSWFEQAE